MSRFRNIIRKLSTRDYHALNVALNESNAGKSARLLQIVRERNPSDEEIMAELRASSGAYYALRSRLSQRIEEYLVEQMESPRTNLMKKVSNINEVMFTKKRSLIKATLKKLEKDLKEYDLSNELSLVYKALKKIHKHSPEYFHYSQLYNRHVAYMLAVDKAEDLLVEYFNKYGDYKITGNDSFQSELILLEKEMSNVCDLYQSHRLYVYRSCMNLFHRLFVEDDDDQPDNNDELPTDEVLFKIESILSEFNLDSTYFHLKKVLEFLWLCYYNHYKVYRKVESLFGDLNESSSILLSNYGLYTFPANFLIIKLERALRLGTEKTLHKENRTLYSEIELDSNNGPEHYIFSMFQVLSAYYADDLKTAVTWTNELINSMSWKKYSIALLEARLFLALLYFIHGEKDLLKQLNGSIQRQIRVFGRENCDIPNAFNKMLRIGISDFRRDKLVKIRAVAESINKLEANYFSPVKMIRLDDRLISRLSKGLPDKRTTKIVRVTG